MIRLLRTKFFSLLTRGMLIAPVAIVSLAPLPASAGYFNDRPDVQRFMTDLSTRYGFSLEELSATFATTDPVPKAIDLILPPTQPGVRSWKRYRSRFIDPVRISKGVEFWQAHEASLLSAEKTYGVPPEIVAGIIGVETIYGRNTGNFSVLSALATLAFDYPPRADLFRSELESLFLLAREQGKPVAGYRGSYAGAIGLPQFLPSSIRKFAVDGDGDGLVDLQNSADDAIASVSNFLAQHGWKQGGRIVEPAFSGDAATTQALVDVGIVPKLLESDLTSAGVRSEHPPTGNELVTLVDLITPGEPTQYWLGFQNFYVITRYNHSSFYAMAVHDLAQALKTEVYARKAMTQSTRAPTATPAVASAGGKAAAKRTSTTARQGKKKPR